MSDIGSLLGLSTLDGFLPWHPAVGAHHQFVAVLVKVLVVGVAQQHQVVEIGGATVSLVDDVMRVAA
ncbi:MAG: hypothetical protein F4117_14760 [Acidimicrobiales bacterium]|nr:hypothetical protein [Acidimicrobiales bacterium]MXX42882.1 hypothetical protein [Acidimicrobiales bacterium]MYB82674.1 hypothetical protein [Acidimicrobiales bacterium]MYD34852.1 hypothetical protein [Acidimicrobiales bacterium]MYI08826.1 hypothetical protein [Acidimicrobiales bacterium]